MLAVLTRVAKGSLAIRKVDQRELWRWERPLRTTGLWPRRDDIVAFHRTWFVPNNSLLAIVGDLTTEEAFAAAEKAFGSWARRDVPAVTYDDPPPPTRRVVVVDRPGAVQTEIRVGQLAVSRTHPEYKTLDLALRILGGEGANPFANMLGAMPGSAQTDPSQWFEGFAPLMQSLQRDGRSWLGLPAFGFAREHQERWQQLAQAQLDLQSQSQAYQALLGEAAQDAFIRFERKLEERSVPGRQRRNRARGPAAG